MNRGRTGVVIALLMLWMPAGPAFGTDAADPVPATDSTVDEIETCIQNNLPDDSSVQTVVLTTVDRIGAENRMRAEIFWAKDEDDRSSVMLRFSDPVEMRGSSLLMLERKPDNDLFMYLPELRRTRRITGRMMAGSLFGTDFSYDEYERLYGLSGDATSSLTGEEELDGRKVWVVESVPAPDSSNHEKVVSRVDQEMCVPLLVEFFENGDEARKRLEVDRARITKEGELWVPRMVTMHDMRDGTHTVLEVEKIALHQEIPRKVFSQRELEKGH